MKHLPVFTITLTAIFLIAFVLVVVERRSARQIADIYAWDISGRVDSVAVAPDMGAVEEPVDLFILVRGDGASDWEWQGNSALIVRITEYGSVNARDTAWCEPTRLRHRALVDAQACQLYSSWTPGVSEEIHISGKLDDLPPGLTTELAAVPQGYHHAARRARDWAWFLGIMYVLGTLVTVRKIRSSRITTSP